MDIRHPVTMADRFALGFAGGCFGLALGGLLGFLFANLSVIWYTAAYFAVVCFVLGTVAADIVALVLTALGLLFMTALGGAAPSNAYEKNPFNRPWHWLLLALFFVGFAAILMHAKEG